MYIFFRKTSIQAVLLTLISIVAGNLLANEYEYSHEDWYGSTEANALSSTLSVLKKDECAYSDVNLSSCNNHLIKIKNLFDGNKLNQNSLDYVFKKTYKDELNGTNMAMTAALDMATGIVDAAINGKQHYFESILRSSKFLEIESSDHLHASQFTQMKDTYFINKSIRPLLADSTCRLESYFMMGGSGQHYAELNCHYKLGSNYLALISDLINEIEGRMEEASAN